MAGTIADYGVGAEAGGFDIVTTARKVMNFAAGSDMLIDGKLVRCIGPAPCANWPRDVVLGISKVRVEYWNTTKDGHSVMVSRRIDRI